MCIASKKSYIEAWDPCPSHPCKVRAEKTIEKCSIIYQNKIHDFKRDMNLVKIPLFLGLDQTGWPICLPGTLSIQVGYQDIQDLNQVNRIHWMSLHNLFNHAMPEETSQNECTLCLHGRKPEFLVFFQKVNTILCRKFTCLFPVTALCNFFCPAVPPHTRASRADRTWAWTL